jgi:hypothetical protein
MILLHYWLGTHYGKKYHELGERSKMMGLILDLSPSS